MERKNVTKFVVCTRKNSRRIPNKPFVKINGKPIIEHLIERLAPILSPVFLAIPKEDIQEYKYLLKKYGPDTIQIYMGHADDPLKRTSDCCAVNGIKNAIRVTHDKIFIDEKDVFEALSVYMQRGLGYLYSSSMVDGTGFEIIHEQVLKVASNQFKNVEHISYAVKAVAINQMDYEFNHNNRGLRLLIDFPEDLTFMQTVFAALGNQCSRSDLYNFLILNPWVSDINRLPLVTVYTCSFNNADSIETTMSSVANQISGQRNAIEYILVDDFSDDGTSLKMSKFSHDSRNWVKYFRNDENKGLAASSNIALSHARGKFIVRIDADDYFSSKQALEKMINEIQERNIDVIYPGFYDGSMNTVGNPRTQHHPAGAMFKTRALNHIKFTDKLRHYEGLDLFLRAREQLEIGYLMEPLFFYTHRQGSMSRTNLEERKQIKENIEMQHSPNGKNEFYDKYKHQLGKSGEDC